MGIAFLGPELFDLWRFKNCNLWFWAVFRDLFCRNFGKYEKTDPPWHTPDTQLSDGIGFVCDENCRRSYAHKMRKRASRTDRQTDGQTDRQTENNIPFSRGIIIVLNLPRCQFSKQDVHLSNQDVNFRNRYVHVRNWDVNFSNRDDNFSNWDVHFSKRNVCCSSRTVMFWRHNLCIKGIRGAVTKFCGFQYMTK